MSTPEAQQPMERLDPRVIELWRVQAGVRLLTFWLPVAGALGTALWFRVGLVSGLAAFGLVLGVQLVLALLWPAVAWRHFGYAVRPRDLLVEQGVLFKRSVSIPLDRIQHVDTRQGPIERAWGVSRLVVYTAAGLSADGSIPGLDEAKAAALRDRLIRRRGDGAV